VPLNRGLDGPQGWSGGFGVYARNYETLYRMWLNESRTGCL